MSQWRFLSASILRLSRCSHAFSPYLSTHAVQCMCWRRTHGTKSTPSVQRDCMWRNSDNLTDGTTHPWADVRVRCQMLSDGVKQQLYAAFVSQQQTMLIKVCCASPAEQLQSLQWLKVIFYEVKKVYRLIRDPSAVAGFTIYLRGPNVHKCQGQKHVGDNKSSQKNK